MVNTVLRTEPDVASQLEQDFASGQLPAVSWISAPRAFNEHPSGISPHLGEYYVNEILKLLAAYPEVFKKTVLIINYDENDGFFDHLPPPLPPLPALEDVGRVSDGIVISSSNDLTDVDREHAMTVAAGAKPVGKFVYPEKPLPTMTMGLGLRVPCVIVSPWTVGGRVCSELFDHTSCLRFLDAWLAAKKKQNREEIFENISSWRRAICGDMTSAFDFTRELDTATKEGSMQLAAAVAASTPISPTAQRASRLR